MRYACCDIFSLPAKLVFMSGHVMKYMPKNSPQFLQINGQGSSGLSSLHLIDDFPIRIKARMAGNQYLSLPHSKIRFRCIPVFFSQAETRQWMTLPPYTHPFWDLIIQEPIPLQSVDFPLPLRFQA
jgi:hypothetical protein